MITYNKMMKLHLELSLSLDELRQHLELVLGDNDYDVSTQIRVDEGNTLTIGFYDPTKGLYFESIIDDEKEFRQMMKLQTAEDLLAFLYARIIA